MAFTSAVQLLQRAVQDSSFRELLFSNPERAFSGYDLTRDETDALKALDHDQFLKGVAEIEALIAKEGAVPEEVWIEFAASNTSVARCSEPPDSQILCI